MFTHFKGGTQAYRDQARLLAASLCDDKQDALRVRVLRGEVAPQDLAAMSADELANQATKQARKSEQVSVGVSSFFQMRTTVLLGLVQSGKVGGHKLQELPGGAQWTMLPEGRRKCPNCARFVVRQQQRWLNGAACTCAATRRSTCVWERRWTRRARSP